VEGFRVSQGFVEEFPGSQHNQKNGFKQQQKLLQPDFNY
jgi:hypothetical protein